MIKYTAHNLKKIELLLEELGYVVRYEKGNFQSVYCIVEDRKIAVINKFFNTEGRINCLLDILQGIDTALIDMSEKTAKTYKEVIKTPSATNQQS